jgi:hypothetical protein
MEKLDALLEEVDKDTLAKLALATAAGIVAVAGGKKLYKNYKERKLLKQYGAQENEDDDKHQSIKDQIRSVIPDIIDANSARHLIDAKSR